MVLDAEEVYAMRWRSVFLAIAATPGFFALGLLAWASPSKPLIILTAGGPTRTLYNWAKDHCRPEYIPDSPTRAFRRADGQIELIATHRENWSMLGRTIS